MASDGSVEIVVSLSKEDFEKGISSVKGDLKSLSSSSLSVSGVINGLSKGLKSVGSAMTSAGKMCTIATTAITAGLGSAISRFDTLKNYPKVLSNLGFSADDAKKSIDALSKGIDGLPTSLDSAASGVQRLVAKNGDIDKSTKYFLAMNDAIVAGNAPAEQQASAIEQLTQSYSKGKPDLMEWRTLMEAMPGQLKQVSTAMGYVDTDGLYNALKNGEISMDDFMDKLVEMDTTSVAGFTSFSEQAHNSCDSVGTAITNLGNRVKKGFATILGSMDEVAKNTSFGSIAGMINNFSTTIKNFLDKLGEGMTKNQAFASFMDKITTSLTKFNSIVSNLSSEQIDKIVTALVKIVEVGPALLIAGKSLSTLGDIFGKFGNVIKPVEGFLGNVTNKFNGFGSSLKEIPGKLSGVASEFTSFGSQITNGLSTVFSGGIFDKIGSSLSTGFSKITSIISGFGGKALAPLQALGGKIGTFLSPVKTAFDKVIASSTIFGQLLKFNISETLNSLFPNVSAGLSKIADAFGGAFQGLIGKVSGFAQSFLPIFTKAFGISAVIGVVIAGLGLLNSQFGEQINNIITTVTTQGPMIITNFVNGILSQLPTLIASGGQLIMSLLNAIIANLPAIISGGMQIVSSLVTGIAQLLPDLIPMAVELVMTIVNSIIANLPYIIESGLQLLVSFIQGIVNAIPKLINMIPTIITTICDVITRELPNILQAGITILVSLIEGLVNAIPQLVAMLPQIIDTIINFIVNNLPLIIDAGIKILIALINGIAEAIPMLIQMLPQIITTIVTCIKNNLPQILAMGVQILQSLIAGIISLLGSLGSAAGKIISTIWDVLKGLPKQALQWGKDMIQGFINGIKSMFSAIGNAAKGIADKVKSFLHFSRPDEGPLRDYEKWMPDMISGMTRSMKTASPKLYNASKELANKIANGFDMANAYNQLQNAVNLENAKLNANLATNEVVKVERVDERQAILKSIDDGKEITVNAVTNLDGKVLTRTVNKVNKDRRLIYGY